MIAWTRLTAPALVCFVAWWGTPSLQASPVTYSTSGTVNISNEPNAYSQIVGVNGVALAPDSFGQYTLGDLRITPLVEGQSSVTPPNASASPFDIHVSFGDRGLPSLELRGIFAWEYDVPSNPSPDWVFRGAVTSITSSNPALDANLPAPFAGALSGRDFLAVHIGMWDWGVNKLPITLTAYEPTTVPEPGTLWLFGVMAAAGLGLGRAKRRHRTK